MLNNHMEGKLSVSVAASELTVQVEIYKVEIFNVFLKLPGDPEVEVENI